MPMEATKASSWPPVCSRISLPVVSRWAATLSGLLNCLAHQMWGLAASTSRHFCRGTISITPPWTLGSRELSRSSVPTSSILAP